MIAESPFSGEKRAEAVVVGAGIAGISCAHHLEKAGFQTIVLEEQAVASGATNYSSGVLYFGSGTDFQTAIKLFGKEKGKVLWDESKQAIDELVQAAKQIAAAGLRETGLTLVARSEEEKNYLEGERAAMSELGYPGEIVSGEELREWFKPRQFVSGLRQPYCFQIKPPVFAKAVAEKLEAQVFENSAMTEIVENNGNDKETVVKTAEGCVRAQQVVVATNIKPFHGLENQFFLEDSVDLPSEELGEQKISEIWPEDTIFSTCDEKYDLFYRHDGKVFFEGYAMKGIEEKARQYFPAETGVVFDKNKAYGDSWAKTRDWLPIVGKVPDKARINCAIAMGDQGIVMGWASGKKIACLLKGENPSFLQMCSPQRFAKQ